MFRIHLLLVVLVLAVSCGGGGTKQPEDTIQDARADAAVDAVTDAGSDTQLSDTKDSADDQVSDDSKDVVDPKDEATPDTDSVDIVEPLPELPTQPPLPKPDDPLKDSTLQSCSLYMEERCNAGVKQKCEVYDTGNGQFLEEPDALLKRAYLFDRWRDLYNSPDGQAVDKDFVNPVPPGTPEEVWGHPSNHKCYCGAGDGGIWTGWSTVASILRYAQTGTRADYERMEQQVRDLVTMYDVTGVPGMLSRSHYLLMPAGGPNSPDHIIRWDDPESLNHHHRPIENPESIPNLPAVYTEGIKDETDFVWHGTPMWHGRPSIDQNTGPMTALPMAYALLEDEELKQRAVHHVTCYFKRLKRVELINLQSNPELIEGLMAYFSVGKLDFDPEDIDLTKLDKIVGYVAVQINSTNEDTFDRTCPATISTEPWRVVDAASDMFFADMLALVSDMDTGSERPDQIDHYYFPSIRGGDAMHLMHLATMSYYLTGEEQYREFLYNELIGNINTVNVMHTNGAFDLPKYCKKYYGDQITYGPWWAFMHLLGDCELRDELYKAFDHEEWGKLIGKVGNVDFNIMYAGAVPPEFAAGRDQALQYAMEQLPWMGGNGGLFQGEPEVLAWLDEPRRSYTLTEDQVLAASPEYIEAVCPAQEDVDICTATVKVMGIDMGNLTGWKTNACTGSSWECEITPGQCVAKMASDPLPVNLRRNTDYLWQRNAFQFGAWSEYPGARQYAGSDYSVPYWNARRYGFITDGGGDVLAWKDHGICPVDR